MSTAWTAAGLSRIVCGTGTRRWRWMREPRHTTSQQHRGVLRLRRRRGTMRTRAACANVGLRRVADCWGTRPGEQGADVQRLASLLALEPVRHGKYRSCVRSWHHERPAEPELLAPKIYSLTRLSIWETGAPPASRHPSDRPAGRSSSSPGRLAPKSLVPAEVLLHLPT